MEGAQVLCAVLLINDKGSKSEPLKEIETWLSTGNPMCWVTDRIPPGGEYCRHDNAHANFREIKLVPTLQELSSERQSWLPLSEGQNAVIENRAIRLLDSNFCLLREDIFYTIKSNIGEQVRTWRNARIIGVNCVGTGKGKKTLSSLTFLFKYILVPLDRKGSTGNRQGLFL